MACPARLSFLAPDLLSDTTTIDAGESYRPSHLSVTSHDDDDDVHDSDSDDDPLHAFAYQHALNLANQRTPQRTMHRNAMHHDIDMLLFLLLCCVC